VERGKRKRDFSSQKTLGGAEVSLRRPNASQERSGKKKVSLLRS